MEGAALWIFLLVWAGAALTCARRAGFFHPLHPERARWVTLTWPALFIYFAIYLGTSFWVGPLLGGIVDSWSNSHTPVSEGTLQSLFHLCYAVALVGSLILFSMTQDRACLRRIWKESPSNHSIRSDMIYGASIWFVAFPLSSLASEIGDWIVFHLLSAPEYEQAAVQYLQNSIGSPFMVLVALITILVAAPTLEEFLFRGILQSWIKKQLGAKSAILISSLIFALFHITAGQGYGNISLVLSLFTFAYFLGSVYEKRGSLFASIALHASFNSISCLRILAEGGAS